jgi:hypothetical protein
MTPVPLPEPQDPGALESSFTVTAEAQRWPYGFLNALHMVTRIVTIGANLDIKAGAALHGYNDLTGSSNPLDIEWCGAAPQMLHLE